jgi:hypothetical protein
MGGDMARAPVFDQTYQHYLQLIGGLDLHALSERLGFAMEEDAAVIELLDRFHRVSSREMMDHQGRRAEFDACIILAKYLLHTPPAENPGSGFATFKDFKDAAPLIDYFRANVEGAIARSYGGRIADLENAAGEIGGIPYAADWSYQLKLRFQGLPRIPIYLLFNDREEGFPAQSTLLFERSAGHYLDMESLAVLGTRLAKALIKG